MSYYKFNTQIAQSANKSERDKKKNTAEVNSLFQAIVGAVRILFLVPDRTVRSTGLGFGIVSAGIVPAASD